MKKALLAALFIFLGTFSHAQDTALSQNFNGTCPTETPAGTGHWLNINTISTAPELSWRCSPTDGKDHTGGIECTGYYGGAAHKDSAYLLTPLLDIHPLLALHSHVYLDFDTKTTNVYSDGRIALVHSVDSPATIEVASYAEYTDSVAPVFSNGDSSDWVTHQVDLTFLNFYSSFYIAFRYTSNDSLGNIWYLDNVHLTSYPLNVTTLQKTNLPLAIIGNSTSDEIAFSFESLDRNSYRVVLYDLMGRQVHEQQLNADNGLAIYHIKGLSLLPGMYFLQIGNGTACGSVKTIVK